jgi:hypothetical protein
MARQLVEKYIFTPGVANSGTVKFPGKCDATQLLIIANKTTQENIYALGDPTRSGSVSFDPDDNTTFFSEQEGVTTVTLSKDTSGMLSSHKIAVYTDAPKNIGNIVRPYAFGVDAIERMRVANPQSLIDADFEYGLQPTKWQNYSEIRGVPGIYEKPGLDLFVTNVTTNGASPSLITVTCSAPHGLQSSDAVIMYGLTGVSNYARAEGAFVIDTALSNTAFTFYAKGIVGNNGNSLYSSSTYARRGGFYTGSELPVSTFVSDGSNPSVITVTCSANHGLVPGAPLVGIVQSAGTNHGLLTGNFFAESVPSPTTFTYTARVGGAVSSAVNLTGLVTTSGSSTTITGASTLFSSELSAGIKIYTSAGVYIGTIASIASNTSATLTANAAVTLIGGSVNKTKIDVKLYTRSDAFVLHRPFDGGVQLGNFLPSHGASISRQTKKYMRYQSGKGILWTSGVLFNPVMNLDQVSSNGTAPGSLMTVTTELDHGLQVGSEVQIAGVVTSGYNGTYGINTILSENSFGLIASTTLGSATSVLTNLPRVTLKNWHGACVRMGPFDDQNGLFWEYDGQELAVVKRSSTYQISGFCTLTPDSQAVTATSGRFTQQLKVGDSIVIRGMTYKVGSITDDNTMTINPAYRGVNASAGIKLAVTIDTRIPQHEFNIDKLDGTGVSGYDINLNKMQMMGISFSWYGAGFIDFMCRGPDGNMIVAHRMKQNNINDEAYMRSGNSAVRYQSINESVSNVLSASINDSVTTIPLEDASRFPTTGGVVLIENECISFTGISGNSLTGCTRGASFQQFVGGTNRTFTGGSAASHAVGNGFTSVILISCTAAPTLNHWGSSYIMDGGFDVDRGYYFSYASLNTTIPTGDVHTVFFLRLAPSVSNSISGDLGDRDLINRSQLLLQKLQVQSNQSVQVYGMLNPSNVDASTLNWSSVNTVSLGSQPSFAQVSEGVTFAADPGEQIFSTLGQPNGFSEIDLSQLKELSNSAIGGYSNFPDGPDVLAVVVKPLPTGITNYEVGNTSSTSYRLNGYANPAITVVRGQTYTFLVNASGHPFWIKTAATTGTGDAYNTGVTNNGDDVGTITWTVDLDAPSTLYYICQNHSAMGGTITVVDGTAANVNVNLFWSEAQA